MESASDKASAIASSIRGPALHDKREGTSIPELLKKFMKDEEGLDLAECALLLVFLVGIVEEVREG